MLAPSRSSSSSTVGSSESRDASSSGASRLAASGAPDSASGKSSPLAITTVSAPSSHRFADTSADVPAREPPAYRTTSVPCSCASARPGPQTASVSAARARTSAHPRPRAGRWSVPNLVASASPRKRLASGRSLPGRRRSVGGIGRRRDLGPVGLLSQFLVHLHTEARRGVPCRPGTDLWTEPAGRSPPVGSPPVHVDVRGASRRLCSSRPFVHRGWARGVDGF